VGSFLTFDFGPRVRAYGHLQARWRLWIYLSNWALFHNNHELINSDADRNRIEIIAHRLEDEGRALTEVEFDSRKRVTSFSFGNFRLLVSPADYLEKADDRDDYWLFFMPHDKVLTAGPYGIRFEQESTRHSEPEEKKPEVEIHATGGRRQIRLED
jgi:hypothetical protein